MTDPHARARSVKACLEGFFAQPVPQQGKATARNADNPCSIIVNSVKSPPVSDVDNQAGRAAP